MSDGSNIEWTDATWNPITGCSIMSPGCTHCYAMKLAGTRLKHHPSRKGLTKPTKAGPVWTGEVRFNEQWLDQPLRWTRPRRIFVAAHSDLFHPNAPDAWVDRIFAIMALAPQHEFQVLTKRPDRMRKYLSSPGVAERWLKAAPKRPANPAVRWAWPLEHIWIGTSVERQKEADERIPHLQETPAVVRFLSMEPLLERVDFRKVPGFNRVSDPKYDWWVIVGGESAGPRARPWDDEWARLILSLCRNAGVPFFMKQVRNKGEIPADLLVREMPRRHLAVAA